MPFKILRTPEDVYHVLAKLHCAAFFSLDQSADRLPTRGLLFTSGLPVLPLVEPLVPTASSNVLIPRQMVGQREALFSSHLPLRAGVSDMLSTGRPSLWIKHIRFLEPGTVALAVSGAAPRIPLSRNCCLC